MDHNVVELVAQPLTAASWSRFGWLPLSDEDPADGVSTLAFDWQDAHVNYIHHSGNEIDHLGDALVCDRMFRHATHTQTLLVLNADSVIAVAAPGSRFDRPADLNQIEVFRLRRGDALVLHQNTWHWGPFPVTEPRVDMFNVQGRRYAEDNDCVELTELGTVLCRSALAVAH